MSRKPTRKVMEYDYSLEAESKTGFDPLRYFFANGVSLIATARAFQEKEAVSYRGVLVGACALTNSTVQETIRVYTCYNYTPFKGAPKHCAEMRSTGRATSDGFSRLDAIVVAGPTDPEVIFSITQAHSPTLHPCEACSEIIQDETVVLTVGGDVDAYEIQTGKELKDLYLPRKSGRARKPGVQTHSATPTILVNDPHFELWGQARASYDQAAEALAHMENDHAGRMARANAAVAAVRELGIPA